MRQSVAQKNHIKKIITEKVSSDLEVKIKVMRQTLGIIYLVPHVTYIIYRTCMCWELQ